MKFHNYNHAVVRIDTSVVVDVELRSVSGEAEYIFVSQKVCSRELFNIL